MTPEQAFDTGARLYLEDAAVIEDSYGRFLVGTVSLGSHAEFEQGKKVITSYLTKEIYSDVYLLRTGFTAFVESWAKVELYGVDAESP